MNREVTIVMYHYVRDMRNSRYPDIKGLSIKSFKKQLGYLRERYTFVTIEQCVKQLHNPAEKFPDNAVLLTFDDGYKEHFTEVFPLLDKLGLQGAFFPPVEAITKSKLLDVNKIHFILASIDNPKYLVDSLNNMISEFREDYDLKEPPTYYKELNLKHRYDPPDVIYFKRMLQRELPDQVRDIILSELFSKFVGIKETVFAKELYMSIDQIKCMKRNGMYIGGHGYSHKWLNSLKPDEQKYEVDKTTEFLETLGVSTNKWVMCYPYGAYDVNLIEILKNKNCVMGLATEVGIAKLQKDYAFHLPRMDTNDFPK